MHRRGYDGYPDDPRLWNMKCAAGRKESEYEWLEGC